jgi:hypothetical protein
MRDSCVMCLQQVARLGRLMPMLWVFMTIAVLLGLCGRMWTEWHMGLHAWVPA